MGVFEFLFHRREPRRRRSTTPPFEGLKAETPAKPLPSLRSPTRFVRALPTNSTVSLSNSGTISDGIPAEATASETISENDLTPSLHEVLVNVALRATAFSNPSLIYGTLSSAMAKPLLRMLLDGVRAEATGGDVALEEIRFHKLRAGRYPCLVVEMPTPQRLREVYFAGILLTADPKTPLHKISSNDLRFFTLEKAGGAEEAETTAFCEWNRVGGRRSFGDGPPPRLERFLGALGGMTT